VKLQGHVVKRPVAVGSKSQRDAVVLVTDSGEFVLRRSGGNPFSDTLLDSLVGKSIEVDGVVHGYTLIVSNWSEGEEGR
jgi:hypothetical protein